MDFRLSPLHPQPARSDSALPTRQCAANAADDDRHEAAVLADLLLLVDRGLITAGLTEDGVGFTAIDGRRGMAAR
jgi:hypothetical protein